MGGESFDVFRFDLEPLLQGQLRIAKRKSAYNLLIIAPTRGFYLNIFICNWTTFIKLQLY